MLSRPRLFIQLGIMVTFILLLSALAMFLVWEGFSFLLRERFEAAKTELSVLASKDINTGGRRRTAETLSVVTMHEGERVSKLAILGLKSDSRFYVRSTAEDWLATGAEGESLPVYRAYSSVVTHSIMIWAAAVVLLGIVAVLGYFGRGTWKALRTEPGLE